MGGTTTDKHGSFKKAISLVMSAVPPLFIYAFLMSAIVYCLCVEMSVFFLPGCKKILLWQISVCCIVC